MSIVAKVGSFEFWKPALVTPLFIANLPKVALQRLGDVLGELAGYTSQPQTDHKWSSPVLRYADGQVLYRVDKNLYRGAQASYEGFADLAHYGIRTVVNLRRYHREAKRIESLAMTHKRIAVNTLTPYSRQIVQFLRIATDPANQPVFVHCLHGADRTGMMCAAYRVVVQDWSVEEAMDEWLRGPYGFHRVFNHLKGFFRSLDFDALRREVYGDCDGNQGERKQIQAKAKSLVSNV